jgi:hypothetical protein
MKAKFISISKSWTTFYPDGSIKDFGLRVIKHRLSYCDWNDEKKDWNYFSFPCSCEICKETSQQAV